MARFENIVFFSPCKFTGGAEYYFIRIAQYLSKQYPEYNIYYADYANNWTSSLVDDYNIKKLVYETGKKTLIPPKSIICISSHLLPQIHDLILFDSDNTVLTLWFMHLRHLSGFCTMDNYYKISRSARINIGGEIKWLYDNGIFNILGNGALLKLSQQFLFKYEPKMSVPIPVPTDKYGNVEIRNRFPDKQIRFCWLGRLDKEKAKNILTYMNELELVSREIKISLAIIGVGIAESMLKSKAKKYSYPIYFVGEKREAELDSFITKNVDIGLASGTSSLEFALRKVPVIQEWLLDKVYSADQRKTYHLVEEYGNFINITEYDFQIVNQGTFSQKLHQILGDYNKYCESAYNRAMTRSPQMCGDKFVAVMHNLEHVDIKESSYHLDSLSKMLQSARNNWMEKIHLRRIFVPLCKILGIKPAVM